MSYAPTMGGLDATLRVALLHVSTLHTRRYFAVLRLKHPTEEMGTVMAYNNTARTEVRQPRMCHLSPATVFRKDPL
jgi:hypothetical protein